MEFLINCFHGIINQPQELTLNCNISWQLPVLFYAFMVLWYNGIKGKERYGTMTAPGVKKLHLFSHSLHIGEYLQSK